MAAASKGVNPVVLRRGVGIGSGNAESDDEFLFECFVEYPAVEQAMRLSAAGMVLAGRTGSGKTAIMRHIEATAPHSVTLDPFDMAMSYVSNSDALRFLQAIGADLDLLFQVLWKHVLCIEYIRLRFSVENTDKSRNVFQKLVDRFDRDDRRKKALAYLKEWEGKFWITMDQNVKELTESVEKKLHAEIGTDIERFKAGGQYDKRLSVEKKSELVARTRKIVSEEQLAELHGVIDILSSFDNNDQMRAHFILVDQLDERWVDDSVRFRMIKALLQSLRSFRKITNLKVLVSLRSDVLERVVQETSDISFQREKFEDYRIDLRWSKTDLRALVDMRLNLLFKRRYTQDTVGFADIFPASIANKDTFDWMLERTLMRPRDIIAFVNECMDAADGQAQISVTALRRAEIEFARKRKDALLQEWRSAFPTLDRLLTLVVKTGRTSFELEELCRDQDGIDDFCLGVCSTPKSGQDPMHGYCQSRIDGNAINDFNVVQEAAAILYRVGAIGLKLEAQDRVSYSHLDQPLIAPTVLSRASRVRLHPMLHAAFNMQDRTAK